MKLSQPFQQNIPIIVMFSQQKIKQNFQNIPEWIIMSSN